MSDPYTSIERLLPVNVGARATVSKLKVLGLDDEAHAIEVLLQEYAQLGNNVRQLLFERSELWEQIESMKKPSKPSPYKKKPLPFKCK